MRDNERARRFQQSMPAPYSQAFTGMEIEEHARIAEERRGSDARVVPLRRLSDGLAVFCVIANDFPGLVARVSGAFLELGLDIRSAQIFSRQRPEGGVEAVDFFWVRARPGSTALADADDSARRVEAVVNGSRELSAIRRAPRRYEGAAESRIFFSRASAEGGEWLLLVDVPDVVGLLHRITAVLHDHGIEIVQSEIETDRGVARDRFLVRSSTPEELVPARIEVVTAALHDGIHALHSSSEW